jgi:hypothetical protein
MGGMDLRPFGELIQPDERVLMLTPARAGNDDATRSELATMMVQQSIVGADLVAAVPDDLRSNYERLRTLHTYGVLCYDLFTVADDLALFVLEQAIGARFVSFHDGKIPLVRPRDGATDTLEVRGISDVYQALHARGSHSKGWQLYACARTRPMPFRATFRDLFAWARAERLLRGQANRSLERLYVEMRNHAAHPSGYKLLWDASSARTIWDVAAIINRLWGSDTPGSRLYPAPVQREVLAVAWDNKGGKSVGHAEHLGSRTPMTDSTFIAVRGVFRDDTLVEFDSEFDLTTFPAELLWGPGSHAEAQAWCDKHQPQGDEIDVLDRLFAVRMHADTIDPPRTPEVTAGLRSARRDGTWSLVRADFPANGWVHVRNVASGSAPCARLGPCEACHATTLATGSWSDIIAAAQAVRGCPVEPEMPRPVSVPGRWHWRETP